MQPLPPLLLLLLLLLLLPAGIRVTSAQRRLIHRLPGLEFKPSFRQYSGYLNSTNGNRLFYWLVEASHSRPASSPLLLWLNGGPGCSSIGGLLMTNGPFTATAAATLSRNRFAWNREVNVLYIDSPAGAGLSHLDSYQATEFNDNHTTEQNVAALLHFYELFPEYRARPFYIAGESYAGIYIPLLAAALLQRKEYPSIVNLTSVAIGNGLHVPIEDPLLQESRNEFATVMGLNMDYSLSIDHFNISINSYNCADPCHKHPSTNIYPCLNTTGLVTYLNNAAVRQALGVLPSIQEYVICQHEKVFRNYNSIERNVLPEIELLVSRNIRVMLYHGHLDLLIPFRTTELLLMNLSSSVPQDSSKVDAWLYCRKLFGTVRLQVGGMHKSFAQGRLVLRSVIGAGHTVPTDLPEAGYQLLLDLLRPSGVSPNCENYRFDDNGDDDGERACNAALSPASARNRLLLLLLLAQLLLQLLLLVLTS